MPLSHEFGLQYIHRLYLISATTGLKTNSKKSSDLFMKIIHTIS